MNKTRIYRGPIFELIQKNILIHDKIYKRDIIVHPGGVGVLAIDQNKILLVRQYRPAIDKETWEIPAGKLEYGEDPKECGLRELNEETGYEAKNLQLITSIYSTPGFCNEKIWIYEAKHITKAAHHLNMDEDEEIEIKWFAIKDAYEMIKKNQIEDAKTIIAIQHAIITKKGLKL